MGYEWPAPVPLGATVGVVAPAGPLDRAALARGVRRLRELGYGVKLGLHLGERCHYLAGEDQARAEDLQRMWADPDVQAVWCARGGYGTMRLFRHLSAEALARPLPLLGYSDITALQMWLLTTRKLVSYSAPMVASGHGFGRRERLDEGTLAALRCCLAAPPGEWALANPSGAPLRRLRGGRAEGPLLGGNLSLVAALVGTPWLPPLDGCLLVLEDVGESPYRVDRMLGQLALAGVFDRIGALVLGDFHECFAPDCADPGPPLEHLVLDWLGERNLPVLGGLEYGHIARRCTVPLGAWCTVDAEASRISVAGAGSLRRIV